MKFLLLLPALLLTLTGRLVAQSYALATGLPLSEIGGTGTSVTLTPTTSSAELPIGFDFAFWENTYSAFFINPNGTLSFETASTESFNHFGQKLGDSPGIHNFIAFAWHRAAYDFTNASVDYFTTGSAPNRVLVVNYKGVGLSQGADTFAGYPKAGIGTINVQVQLFEGPDGKIQIHSTDNKTIGGDGDDSGPGTVGIENKTGDESKMAGEYKGVYATLPFGGVVMTYRYFYDFSGKMVQLKKCTHPAVPAITASNLSVCAERPSVTLTASGAPAGAQYDWGSGLTGSQISVSNGGYFRAKAIVDGCESAWSQETVIQSLTGALSISSNIEAVTCYTPAVTLTSDYMGPAGTYTWTDGSTILQNSNSYQYTFATQAAATTYKVSYTYDGCTTPEGVGKTITGGCVPAPSAPVITSQTSAPFCSGYTITLKATGCPADGVITWNDNSSITGDTFVTPVLTAGEQQNDGAGYASYSYWATCTHDGQTSSAGYWSGSVYAVPAAPSSVSASPDTPVEPGTSVSLTANYSGTAWPVVWSWNNDAGTATGNPLSVTPQVTTEYFAERSNNGCKSTPVSKTITVNQPQTVTIASTTPDWACGSKGQQFTVSYQTTGTFSNNNFLVKLVKISSDCSGAVSTDILSQANSNGVQMLTWPSNLAPSSSFGCPATAVSYKIVVQNQGNAAIKAELPITVYLPDVAISSATPEVITEAGQSVQLSSMPDATVSKSWYFHSETEYWQPGTALGRSADNVTVNPATSTYYSVVATEAHGCAQRSARIRVPFTVTITGTGSATDQTYAEGQGVHLDTWAIVSGTGNPYPQFYAPPGADSEAKVYSTIFDTGYPTSWNGYFIIRKNNYWEIYHGNRPTYSYATYTRIYHTKNAFPTVTSGSRRAFRSASEPTGTRPPLNAVWIKDADNSEVALNLSGVSEDYGALPVSLVYFNAAVNDEKQVELTWETTTENSSEYFTIERSHTGQEFISIGTVKSGGSTGKGLAYRFTDRQPFGGTSYYRLMQTDRDGSSTAFQIVSVHISHDIGVFPNPSDGRMITVEAPEGSVAALFDLTGREIPFLSDRRAGALEIRPKVVLQPGIYLIRVGGSTLKWVVQ